MSWVKRYLGKRVNVVVHHAYDAYRLWLQLGAQRIRLLLEVICKKKRLSLK